LAGKINSKGYRLIGVDGRWHKAHRLAWLYMTGSWPREQIDHINLIKNDNRFENLREATQTQNHANTRARRRGLKGITWSPQFWGVLRSGRGPGAELRRVRPSCSNHNDGQISSSKIPEDQQQAAFKGVFDERRSQADERRVGRRGAA
jgi:hypothetical protein